MIIWVLGCYTPDWSSELDVAVIGTPQKIIVVGAGISGLAAAAALHADGREVIVLEARDRIGGRTWTADVEGARVDLGGAWIHGPRGNPLALLMEGQGQTWSDDNPTPGPFVDHTGEAISAREQRRAYSFAEDLLSRAEDILDDMGVADASVAEGVEHRLDEDGHTGVARRVRRFMANQAYGALDLGGPAADTSLARAWESEDFAGGDVVPDGGYALLIDALAEGLDVRLSEPVTHIDWSRDTVRIETTTSSYETTHAIITLPLGVLQAGSVAFTPPLPDDKQASIDALAVGSLEKVILRFERRFWLDDGETFVYLDEEEGRFPSCVDFSPHAGAPTLACFTGGSFSQESRETMSEQEMVDGTLANFSAALGRDVPTPLAHAVTDWHSDPHSMGSYSYVPVGSSLDAFDTMAAPVGDRLLFAGEHTAGPYYQTVHGALISGLREARRLGVRDLGLDGLGAF